MARKQPNPEIEEAMNVRDQLLEDVKHAVRKVDRLQDELLQEYADAERVERTRWKLPRSWLG